MFIVHKFGDKTGTRAAPAEERRMSEIAPRRRVAAACVLALVGCLAGLGGAISPSAAAPRTDLVIGMNIEPSGLDPTIAAPVAIGQVTWRNVFEGLVRIDSAGKVQPDLARSWTISPDGLTYTFALQTGVTFHDGTPFDSSVAKFALDRARGATSVNPQKQFFATISAVETPDPATLVVRLAKPTGNLLYWLGWPAAVMVAPNSAEADKTTPVGTGPFRFKTWAKGDRVELERSPTYWDRAHPVSLDRVTFRFLPDPQAQAAALRSGGVDAIPEFEAPELFAAFKSDPRFAAVAGNTELKVVAGFNTARKPFDDKRVRQALMSAVDRAALIEGAFSGLGQPIGSHYTPNDPGYVDLTGVWPYDTAKAKALLAEAGFPNGLSLSIKVPQMAYATRSAQVLQAMFAEIGVTLTIVPTEFPAAWIQQVFLSHDFDLTIVAHAEPMDIAIYARPDYYFGYRNPALDAAVARAEAASDPAVRDAAYGEAQRILAADVPALYLFVIPKLGIWNAKLHGLWTNEPIPSNDLTEVGWSE